MQFGVGFIELVMLLMSGGGLFSGGGLMGLPAGERDAALIKCAPADALIYAEWAERSKGEAGAPGIDGLAADPEIQTFLKDLDAAITTMIERETANGNADEQVFGKALPPLIKTLLMKPGCLYATVDSEAAAKALEQGDPIAPGGSILAGARVTLIVNAGNDADAMAGHIDHLLDVMVNELGLEKTENIERQAIPLPLPGGSLTLHRQGKYFIVGFGEGTIDQAVAGLAGKSQGINANKRYADALARVQMERTASVAWVDVKGLVTKTSQALGLQGAMIVGMAKMVGADAVDSFATSTGIVDGQIRTRTFVNTGGKTDGVLALAAGRAISKEDFDEVPSDADFVFAGSLNLPKILAAAREIVGNADPQSKENMEMMLRQVEAELGVSLENDVFPAFGDVWTLYDSPGAAGTFLTAPVLALEVRDAEKANKVFGQLMSVFKNALPGDQGDQFRRRGVFLEQLKFRDRDVYYVNTVGEQMPIAPAFCVTDKQLLVALHPQPLKAHLRFLASKEPRFSSQIGSNHKLPEGDLLQLTYFDAKTFVRLAYGLTPWVGQVMFSEFQREGFPMSVGSLPSGRALLPYINKSLSATVRTKEGIMIDSQSALPIPGGSIGFLSLPMSFFMVGFRSVPILDLQQKPALMQAAPLRQAPEVLKAQPPVPPAKPVKQNPALAP